MNIHSAIIQASQKIQLTKINRQLPQLTIQTAPSLKTYWFEIQKITFDMTTYDETTGQLGVFFCEGIQHYIDSKGQPATMRRDLPAYVLASAD